MGAYRVSQQDPVTWASELTGWAVLDACQLVSQVGLAPTGNLVDTNVTMLAKLPKRYLGGAGPAGGMHGRLRETAAAYLRQR